MHGREGENRIRSRHMWSVPTRGTAVRRTKSSTADSFCKGGRKISVGDCALFEPAQDSPPFIGLIPWLALNKDNNLQLGVNWLYRPGDLKLCKGVLLDAAPNEVFYSFHKDEIPAASLLHPCKVAFLPKGVELPSGISSFVCRRVFDVANKCLWWLTDQDYIDERQQEVDKLLYKTRLQMYPTVQPGGHSPKPLHVPTSTSQLKPGANNVPGSGSFPSQAKGKKRERADQDNVPVKRERSSMSDNGNPVQFKPENNLKYEISKITEKGGLVDPEGVEKLVQLMQPDRAERRMELISRSMLAGVIAATEKFDCLSRFVQLKGLLVLDEWLQDAHKGKIGDGSPKEGDKSLEDFLLVLLHALDKLPVNLHALQMCNIGKSVNHLRSHKNMEIQKKARSLVDMWKKRVEAEMNVIEAKPGSAQAVSWPSKSHLPEISHGGNQHPGGFSEAAMKSAVTQLSASKNASVKPASEITAKSSSSPGTMKSAVSPGLGKNSHPRIVVGNTSDLPSTTAREERSSSSSQSHNNGQSCSSDLAKTTVFSGKEDAKSSTAGSINVSKMSGSSRHRRSLNGFSGPAVSGGNRETGSSRSSSVHRNSAAEKLSPSGLTCEKDLDVPIVEGNSHKLIVKIPTRGRSPAQSASGGSFDGHSNINSRASSPVLSDKYDQSDRNSKVKIDANRADPTYDVKTESWQSNDFKDVLTGSDEGDGSPAAIPEEERRRPGDDAAKLAEISRAASSSSGDELKSGKLHGASFSSINALIDSCVKYTEANASMSVGDDVGMNLLATVAAGEISRSDTISQIDSPWGNTPLAEDSIVGNDAKSKSFHGNNLPQEQRISADGAVDIEKQTVIAGASWSRDELYHLCKQTSGNISGEGNEYHSCNLDLQPSAEPCLEVNGRSNVLGDAASVAASPAIAADKLVDGEKSKQHTEKTASVTTASIDDIQDTKPKRSCSLLTDDKVCEVLPSEFDKEVVEGSLPHASLENSSENKINGNEGCDGDHTERKPPLGPTQSENLETNDEGNNSGSGKDLTSENADVDGGKSGKADTRIQGGKRKFDYGANSAPSNEKQVLVGLAVRDEKSLGMEANGESKDVLDHCSGGAVTQKESPLHAQELEQHKISRGPKMTDAEADETEESASTAADASSSPAEAPNTDTKLKFDLNEGFAADEGKWGEPLNFVGPGSSASVQLVNRLPYRVPSVSSGLPASITVAAAAKRPFVPPEDLLRSKGELGWKGSAATSAFRPAEPRKFLEMPLGTSTTNIPLPDTTANKHPRPLLDIDLNVPDERILEDMASRNFAQETASTSEHTSNRDLARNGPTGSAPVSRSRGLVLDLNLVDEASDMGQHSTSISRRLEAPFLPVKMSSTGGFPNSEVRRDFDLNDGPVLDEAVAEPLLFSQHVRSSMQSHPPVAGLRMNNAEMAWFPTGNTYSTLTVPSILADRGEHPFPVASGGLPRMSGPSTSGTPFTPDVFRGSMLSSPAMPFPSTPFQYPVFPFGNSFPMPSAAFSGGSTSFMDSSSGGRLSFPAISSQFLGPASTLSSQYPRPYVVSLPDGSSNIVDNSRKWGRQGLDLNAGPGNLDMEGRDETSPLASRHLSVVNSQVLAEEQARMYQQMAGSILKRKEPEGGWDAESFRHKQSSWQ